MTPSELISIIKLESNVRKALDILYHNIESWIESDDFESYNGFLEQIIVSEHSITILVGILTITVLNKEYHTEERRLFYERVKVYLEQTDPKRVVSLIGNLK